MNLNRRLESIEQAQAKRNGQLLCNVFIRHDDETDTEARARLDIPEAATVIFLSETDANL